MAQENPRPELGFDGICIGVPVPYGYPIAPPHPAPTVSGHSAPPQTSSGSESSEKQTPRQCLMEVCVLLLFITIIWGAFAAYLVYTTPSFRVASVSVLLDKSNDSSLATCTWNLGLSVKAGKVFNEFDFNDLEVLFRCMSSSNWSRTVLVQSSNDRDPKNMTSLNATVDTLLPRSFQGSTLEFDVMFQVRFADDTIQAVCNNLTVVFLPDATEGMMEGGPRPCHID